MPKMTFQEQRMEMVNHLKNMGYVKSKNIEDAMLKVKREQFVWERYRTDAYADTPLPIPGGVTVSAPHMHAIFMSALKLKAGDKVLEVGAGSGILLAYMKEVVGTKGKVYGVEIIKETYEFAKKNLQKAGYTRKVKLVLGDGSKGLSEYAPYDKIVSGASAPKIPKPWIKQLKPGGIIVTPIGPTYGSQDLIYLEKTKKGKIIRKNLGGVIFVPLVGQFGYDF
jgi:protein-L-isoaspartate(D-aspartate) O-methyltransferase